MPEYTRPAIATRQFRKDSGNLIRYGARWTGSPPDDSYSRVSHPERFGPLQTVADALIEHLRAGYRVDVATHNDSPTTPHTTKLVSVAPDRHDCAPLSFRFTDFPGVILTAGLRHDAPFPACGCDACDETWESGADEMERLVFAVAEGRFSERIAFLPGGRAWVEHNIETPSGAVRSGTAHGLDADDALHADAARLDRLPDGRWQPWPSPKRDRLLHDM